MSSNNPTPEVSTVTHFPASRIVHPENTGPREWRPDPTRRVKTSQRQTSLAAIDIMRVIDWPPVEELAAQNRHYELLKANDMDIWGVVSALNPEMVDCSNQEQVDRLMQMQERVAASPELHELGHIASDIYEASSHYAYAQIMQQLRPMEKNARNRAAMRFNLEQCCEQHLGLGTHQMNELMRSFDVELDKYIKQAKAQGAGRVE